MKFSKIISLAFGFATVVSGAAVITSSGSEVPESLMTYLSCPIGDVVCKNGKEKSCLNSESYKICDSGNPLILDELLSKSGVNIDNLDAPEFCKIHKEVCSMVTTYDQPLTRDYVYDLDRYLTCDKTDTICQYGKVTSCRAVLKLCWGNYPTKDCQKLSNTCDKLTNLDEINSVKESFTTTTKKVSTKRITITTKKTVTKTAKV